MNEVEANFLREKADYIRKEVIKVSINNNAGHIAPSLSCVDMLVVLYYSVMKYDSKNPQWEDRDRLIFSKGHGCYALYAILADLGFIPKEEWYNFYTEKSTLFGCVERDIKYGLEVSCGSLGHGLPMAVGIAFGAKLQQKSYHVFCIVGDGELQEGSCWEALQFAVKQELSNLTIIVDKNRLQAMDFIINILDVGEDNCFLRLRGFGLFPVVCFGHDVVELAKCLTVLKSSQTKRPKVVMAETTKGYGLKCMENIPKFHFRIPSIEEIYKNE